MNFQIEYHKGFSIITTKVDKLNANLSPELKGIFVDVNKNNIHSMIIDMTDTSYCDSSGLSALLTANRLCKNSNGNFVLCGLQENVRKMIEIAQLHRVLNIEETLPDALAFIKNEIED